MLHYIVEKSKALTSKHLYKHIEAGLEIDEWTEVIDGLITLTQRYAADDDGRCSDSD